ncbi:MAG: subclass B3 metallo-beta-lactamase, partial [Caulobacteraceae bacterium]
AFSRPADWTQPVAPFRIVGNVYYVGTRGLAAYLITSPAGDILIDGTLAENAPLIERNITTLGVRLKDVKVLVNSHAHSDHAGGLAQLKRDTGALMMASQGDRWSLDHGRHLGDNIYGPGTFPPVPVDRVLKDGDAIRLGGVVLTPHLTPGHTRGCTTWSLPVRDAGRTLEVVVPCSLTVAGNVLVGNRTYPTIAADYRRSFARLRAMKADVG